MNETYICDDLHQDRAMINMVEQRWAVHIHAMLTEHDMAEVLIVTVRNCKSWDELRQVGLPKAIWLK